MTQLGKYDLHEELGRGGFGTVYRATDTTLGREVALKVLHPQLTTDPDFLDKFRKEARTVAQLKSRDIVTIYELGEIDGRVFIAMEYMEGGSLKDKLEKEGALSFEKTLKIMRQVCAGLDKAHKMGLVHQDIKPANILFDEDGNALISDFGLARAVQNASRAAKEGMGLSGTAAYRAPEIWQGTPPVSAATDIYSLGCILSEMLSGETLFDGNTPEQILTQHLINGPSIPTKIPQEMQDILKIALAKDPAQRFSGSKDLLIEFEGSQPKKKQEPTATPPVEAAKEAPARPRPVTPEKNPAQPPAAQKPGDKRLIIGLAAGGLAIALLVWGINALSVPAAAPAAASTAVPTQRPASSTGSTFVAENDGMTMVYVPAGEFEMGSENGGSDESPVHTVYLDAYYIDQTEVTNAQYKLCEQAGKCDQPSDTTNYNNSSYADHPVVYVSWNDANDYCEWAGRQLPTEAQWEKAARGTDGRIYPWGNVFDGNKLNYCDSNCEYDWKDTSKNDGYSQTAPVGSYPEGASPYGALDMAGNVWEWVADWYNSDYYRISPESNPSGPSDGTERVLRGGSWVSNERIVRSAYRSYDGPNSSSYNYGFRCACLP